MDGAEKSLLFSFKWSLYSISNKLTGPDVSKMKFILSDFLPRQQLEKAKTGFAVLCLMCDRGELLSPKDYSFLEEVLREVGKDAIVKSCLSSSPSIPAFIDSSNRNSVSQYLRPKLSQVKKFLGEIGDRLSSENIRDLCLFFAGICESINYQNADSIKTAEELFSRLLESHLIGTGHLQPLQRVLELIGRLDLASSIETFNSGVWQSVNDTPSLPTPAEDDTPSLPTPAQDQHLLGIGGMVLSSPEVDSSLQERDLASSTQQLLINIGIQEESVERQQDEIIHLRRQLEKSRDEDNAELQLVKKELGRKTAEVMTLNDSLVKLQELLWAKPDIPLYDMKKDPHGLAVVIVNSFDCASHGTSLKPRRGAVKDRDCFIRAFESLNYTVNVYSDMTAEESRSLMVRVGSCDHSEYDSFVCCVSSHGNEIGIYGNDGVLLHRNAFIDPMKSCSSLRSKPKLFFFQACRVPEVLADMPKEYSLSEPPLSPLHRDSDILIANASTAGHPAYTSPETGSWFAKAVEMKFTNPQLVYQRTLQQLLEEVTDVVSGAEGQLSSGERVNQCVEVTTRMRKGVKFF